MSTPTVSLTSRVNTGSFLHFSEPEFLICRMGVLTVAVVRMTWSVCVPGFDECLECRTLNKSLSSCSNCTPHNSRGCHSPHAPQDFSCYCDSLLVDGKQGS